MCNYILRLKLKIGAANQIFFDNLEELGILWVRFVQNCNIYLSKLQIVFFQIVGSFVPNMKCCLQSTGWWEQIRYGKSSGSFRRKLNHHWKRTSLKRGRDDHWKRKTPSTNLRSQVISEPSSVKSRSSSTKTDIWKTLTSCVVCLERQKDSLKENGD